MVVNDLPKQVIIRAYKTPKEVVEIHNECYIDESSMYNFNCLDLGGYPFRVATQGTAVTSSSISSTATMHSTTLNFVPRDGIIPEVEMQRQYVGHLLDLVKQEPIKK